MKIRAIVKRSAEPFQIYFKFLCMALYLISGENEMSEKTAIEPMDSHLRDLGLVWNFIYMYSPSFITLAPKSMHGDIDSIFKVAFQWGLDIKKIAAVTESWCITSKEILAGNLPEDIKAAGSGSVLDIISIISGPHAELIFQDYDILRWGYFDAPEVKLEMLRQGYVFPPREIYVTNVQNSAWLGHLITAEPERKVTIEPEASGDFSAATAMIDDEEMDEEDWLWTTYYETHMDSI